MLRFPKWTISILSACLSPTFLMAQISEGAASAPSVMPEGSSYVLGPGDQVTVRVLDAEEIGQSPFTIDMRGYINVPLAGRVRAAGLTVDEIEDDLSIRLRQYLQAPIVTVFVSEFQSQPVSVLGAVNTPGILQVRGRKNLFEVISEAGGLRNDAGNSIKITRRKEFGPIPLPGGAFDASGHFYVAEISLESVMEARNPAGNIEIRPNDVISVPRTELVYVIGAVKRSGGFVLNEREHISVLQALAMAEGLDRAAAPGHAKILRAAEGSTDRKEIPVSLNAILAGKSDDIPLLADDILFIPSNKAKTAALRAVEAAIQMGTGVVIWRR